MKEAYQKWEKSFKATRLGNKALKLLSTEMKSYCPEQYVNLEREVLIACFQAHQFSQSGDDYDIRRDRFNEISKKPRSNSTDITVQLEAVIAHIENYSDIYQDIFNEGSSDPTPKEINELEQYNRYVPDHKSVLLFCLKRYRRGIKKLRSNQSTFPMREECWVYGNMRFPTRIDEKNQHRRYEASTMLMFQLGVFFKLWTVPDRQSLFNKENSFNFYRRGLPMPAAGAIKPEIIIDFVRATFADSKTTSHREVTKRLEKIDSGITLVLWPREDLPNFQ